jgi:hypothetical protein
VHQAVEKATGDTVTPRLREGSFFDPEDCDDTSCDENIGENVSIVWKAIDEETIAQPESIDDANRFNRNGENGTLNYIMLAIGTLSGDIIWALALVGALLVVQALIF